MQDKEEITEHALTVQTTANKGIPIEKIMEYRGRGLTIREIAKLVECSPSNVHARLQAIADDIDNLPLYRKHRADLLALKGKELYESMDAEAIAKASLSQRVVAFGILTDKERMERGETTHNIGIADFTRRISDIDRELAQLEAEVGHDQE